MFHAFHISFDTIHAIRIPCNPFHSYNSYFIPYKSIKFVSFHTFHVIHTSHSMQFILRYQCNTYISHFNAVHNPLSMHYKSFSCYYFILVVLFYSFGPCSSSHIIPNISTVLCHSRESYRSSQSPVIQFRSIQSYHFNHVQSY